MLNVFISLKNFMVLHKKAMIAVSGSIFGIALVTTLVIVLTPMETKIKNRVIGIGKDFYENTYYQTIVDYNKSNNVNLFEERIETGFRFSFAVLARSSDEYESIIAEFHNDETMEPCDLQSSIVVIYPTAPYSKKDYSIGVDLVCGFSSE